jgi:hypothetical protein
MPNKYRLAATALSLPLLWVLAFNSLPTAPVRPGSHRVPAEVTAQNAAMRELLKSLPDKSFRQKIEAAHDGAQRTHEIAFPDRQGK